MKKFAFSLRPLLEMRERAEEEKQLALAARERELQAAKDELARLNATFKSVSAALRDRHKDLGANELRAHYAHLQFMDRAMVMQHAVIANAQRMVDAARAELMQASKDRKVIDTLRERRLSEHNELVAAEEQKELDDSNNRRFTRNMS